MGGLADVVARKRDAGEAVAYSDPETKRALDPERWRALTLPHDWVVETPFVNDPADQTHGFHPRGVGFYRKVFTLPGRDAGRRISLEFDGVFRSSTVWVNGHHVLDHRSGYTSFAADLSTVARYGAEGPNCVLVRVDAREKEGWWYEGGGIYRHVWLVRTGPVRVARWGTFARTAALTARRATVLLDVAVENGTGRRAACVVETALVDDRGRTVARARTRAGVPAAGRATVTQRFTVTRPRLWSSDAPRRYGARTGIRAGGRLVDAYETRFGIRTARFDPKRGFLLNGVVTPLKGTCNHQDFAGVGVALPDSLHRWKIDRLREMGSNAYRCAHHPPAPELLDYCDRVGMLVLDENRKLDASAQGLEDLRALIERDRNHPSVIAWCLENEERLEGTPMGARILGRLAAEARRLDPSRQTTAAQNHGHVRLYQGQVDVAGFNYGHNLDKDAAYHRANPDQPVMATESNATIATRGEYASEPRRGVVMAYGTQMATPPWPWNSDYEVPWRAYERHPFLSGVFIWSGFDYRGEPSPYGWPCVNSNYGVMDTCGFPKDGYWHHKAMFTAGPVLHVFPDWNRAPGSTVAVWAFTNCDRVQLWLNGRFLGARDVTRGRHAEWSVRFEPGALRAVGWRGGRIVTETVVETAGKPHALRLEADRARLAADGMDALPVRVSVVDRAGRVVPGAANDVRFSVNGPARIIGVGNGDPSSHEPDKGAGPEPCRRARRRAFHGRCLVIVQSTGGRGRAKLSARAAGLKPARLGLRAGSGTP